MVIGLYLPLSTNVVSLYTGPCAEQCGFLVAVEDFAVEDMAVDDLVVEDLAVDDFAVDDLAVEDCSRRLGSRRLCRFGGLCSR